MSKLNQTASLQDYFTYDSLYDQSVSAIGYVSGAILNILLKKDFESFK